MSSVPSPAAPVRARAGLRFVLAGAACEAAGFFILSRGSTVAAPLLIVGSFVVMGLGIWVGWD